MQIVVQMKKRPVSKATVGLWLDTRRQKADGTYPVKLRVTYQRSYELVTLPDYYFTKSDWKAITTENPRGRLKDKKIAVYAQLSKAQDILENIKEFSFQSFKDAFGGKVITAQSLLFSECMQVRVRNYFEQGRIGSSDNAKCALRSMMEYFDGADLDLREITARELQGYADWMTKRGKSQATIGMYTREIRVMYNELIEADILQPQDYPFGKKGFQPPSAKKKKLALMKEDVRKIIDYKANTASKEAYCRDLWVFSYLCNGMNVKDVANLRYKNLQGDYISFVRAKTRRTKNTEEPIQVPVLSLAKEIINKWGNPFVKADNYIFPVLREGMTPLQEKRTVQNLAGLITDHMRNIAKILNLSMQDITSNTARDAFATISQTEGRPLSDISESLGHSSVAVTEHYLAGFSNSVKTEWQKRLL